jgi:putative transcriptional regulator
VNIENKLKLQRVQNGDITQQQLADRVQCSRQTIHSIENGKFVPSVELALKIALALGVKIEDIFLLKGIPNAK